MSKKITSSIFFLLLSFGLIHCGSDSTTPPAPTYSVGGKVEGLNGTLVIRNNGTDPLTITADGPYTFDMQLEDKASYDVTILTLPSGQACSVFLGTGTIDAHNVTNIKITCSS